MLKNTLKWIGLVVSGIIFIGLGVAWVLNEIRPTGVPGEAADRLARKMESALNVTAWDTTGAVTFGFAGARHVWDRKRQLSKVIWDDHEVLVDLTTREGLARYRGEILSGKEATTAINKAWKRWVNDSFWLTAPFKAFDTGVTRELVIDSSGDSTLMVAYQTGGSTPGDAYLWKLDETGRPVSWKMWVSIIPVGGLEVPFDGWTETETGVILPTMHSGILSIELTDVKTTSDLKDWYQDEDIFAPLLKKLSR